MNDFGRQILILIAVMALLMAITLFALRTPSVNSDSPDLSPDISLTVSNYNGPGSQIINQSLTGLGLMYEDITRLTNSKTDED